MRKWQCIVCGFIYDEAVGLPEEGIAAGTRWEEIPENWSRPDCGIVKADFEMVLPPPESLSRAMRTGKFPAVIRANSTGDHEQYGNH